MEMGGNKYLAEPLYGGKTEGKGGRNRVSLV